MDKTTVPPAEPLAPASDDLNVYQLIALGTLPALRAPRVPS